MMYYTGIPVRDMNGCLLGWYDQPSGPRIVLYEFREIGKSGCTLHRLWVMNHDSCQRYATTNSSATLNALQRKSNFSPVLQ